MSDKIHTDEISMIDIIAVVLRYRRMILIVTAVAVVLSLAAAAVLPSYQINKAVENEYYAGIMTCSPSIGLISFMKEKEALQFVMQTLNDPAVVLSALKASGTPLIGGVESGSEESSLLSAVRSSFIGSAYTVSENDGIIKVSVSLPEKNETEIFLDSLEENANSRLRRILAPAAEAEISGFERIINIEYPRAVIEENLVDTFRSYTSALSFLSGEEPGLLSVQTPNVYLSAVNKTAVRNSMIKQGIIISAAVFFMMIILAFILNWVENVKHDPESMKKIHAAVKRERV